MGAESAVTIGLLLPDVLGTYGDRGNAAVLAQRLRWRGLDSRILQFPAGTTPSAGCDIYLLGGGEDAAGHYAVDWLSRHPALRSALGRSQVLAVCAGLQVLGLWVRDRTGRTRPGAEIVDLTTAAEGRRAIGEAVARCRLPGVGTLTGFENHAGRTALGVGVEPLGAVVRGVGNGDGSDGVLAGGIVGTYFHGPVLARNPALADLILSRAVGRDLGPLALPDEESARRAHLAAGSAGSRLAVRFPRRPRATSRGGFRR
jgi:CobQ-like glutamine amidotransferase family enzyme